MSLRYFTGRGLSFERQNYVVVHLEQRKVSSRDCLSKYSSRQSSEQVD